jgi:hypothetical protein
MLLLCDTFDILLARQQQRRELETLFGFLICSISLANQRGSTALCHDSTRHTGSRTFSLSLVVAIEHNLYSFEGFLLSLSLFYSLFDCYR